MARIRIKRSRASGVVSSLVWSWYPPDFSSRKLSRVLEAKTVLAQRLCIGGFVTCHNKGDHLGNPADRPEPGGLAQQPLLKALGAERTDSLQLVGTDR